MGKSRKSSDKSAWGADWEIGIRIWVERQGQTLLGHGRADLMAAIQRTGSITSAAKSLGMSYRHAWKLLQEANEAAGEPLVQATAGGRKGGGAELTPRGKLSLEVFQELRGQLRAKAAALLQQTLHSDSAAQATVHLSAAISLEEVVGQLLTEFALKQPTIRVRAVFGASNELADHILAGAPCDVFASADASHLARLAAAGCVRGRSRAVFARNRLAVIGPANKPPALQRSSELAGAGRIAVADPASPLGKCTLSYLSGLGLYDSLHSKMVPVDNSRGILAAIRSGCADVGIAFASDAAQATDCRILLAIDAAQAGVSYTAAVCSAARKPEALELLNFFKTPTAHRALVRCGFDMPKKTK